MHGNLHADQKKDFSKMKNLFLVNCLKRKTIGSKDSPVFKGRQSKQKEDSMSRKIKANQAFKTLEAEGRNKLAPLRNQRMDIKNK